jgi:hypothetical protein
MPERSAKEHRQQMERLLEGYVQTKLLYVAAKLGLADLMTEGPKSSEELATLTATHPLALSLLLRSLAEMGIFAQDEKGRLGVTPLGAFLRSDGADSILGEAIWAGEIDYSAWGELLHTVRTGESGFQRAHGMPFWEYLAQHPGASDFHTSVASSAGRIAPALLDAYDFSQFHLLVDLGGGYGGLLAAILQTHPSLQGIVFDLPGLREGAERLLQDQGVATRCSFVGGSLLEAVPGGGDANLLLRMLRNLDDRSVLLALRNCREVMDRVATLLIIERLRGVADGCPPTSLALLIEGSGAHDRTEADHSTLLQAAGFRLGSILPTASGLSILEAVPDL